MKKDKFDQIRKQVKEQIDQDIYIETSNGIRPVSAWSIENNLTQQEVIQQAKNEDYGHIRLVGQNEARGRILSSLMAGLK